ncbi:unnamed protein product [Blepharisma stoltei]|uniref:Uncharacterized protein n=1 Tax=Blepharisma stoltei TaxID=1481888 RepID=A0AAU9JNY3_9CILI|nr:unnamed protein product [Blepharisma stoltei]
MWKFLMLINLNSKNWYLRPMSLIHNKKPCRDVRLCGLFSIQPRQKLEVGQEFYMLEATKMRNIIRTEKKRVFKAFLYSAVHRVQIYQVLFERD